MDFYSKGISDTYDIIIMPSKCFEGIIVMAYCGFGVQITYVGRRCMEKIV